MTTRLPTLLAVLSLTGCGLGSVDAHDAHNSARTAGIPALVEVAAPCDGGTWGDIDDPAAALHVRSWGSDRSGDGSRQRPFATVDAAVAWGVAHRDAPASAAADTGTCRTLDFEASADGTAVLAGQVLDEEWAAWGVHIEVFDASFSDAHTGIALDSANPSASERDLGTPNQAWGGPGRGEAGAASNTRPLGMVLVRSQYDLRDDTCDDDDDHDHDEGEGESDDHGSRSGRDHDADPHDNDGDGLVDSPKAHSAGAGFRFRFDAPQCVETLDLVNLRDSAQASTLVLRDALGNELLTLGVAGTGANSVTTAGIETCGVSTVEVSLPQHGAIDNLVVCDAPAVGTAPAEPPLTVAVGPGTFKTGLSLIYRRDRPSPPVRVEGCSAAETTLVPLVDGAVTARVHRRQLTLDGLTVSGGRKALQASGQGGHLTLEDVTVTGVAELGVVAKDRGRVDLLRSHVIDPVVTADGKGWGVAAIDGSVSLIDSGILRANEIGLFAQRSDVLLYNSEISYTKALSGALYGRGLMAQDQSAVTAISSLFIANRNAAIFGQDLDWFHAEGLIIDITGAGVRMPTSPGDSLIIDITGAGFTLPGATAGDGIVLVGGPVTRFQAYLADNLVSDSSRAAILLDTVDATLDGNVAVDNGLVTDGSSLFSQGGSLVDGLDATQVRVLLPGQELPLYTQPVVISLP